MDDAAKSELRTEMVEAARKFMLTPKVLETPFEEQKQFLLGKGVTEAEIQEARSSIPAEKLQPRVNNDVNTVPYGNYPPPPMTQQNKVLALAQTAVVIGSISYAGYRFMRSFILPKFFNIPDPASEELRQLQNQVDDLQNSIKFIMDSISQTTQKLATQQAEISKALYSLSSRDADLSRIESGISAIKGLMLSKHNFAPIVTPSISTIPSWQQGNDKKSSPATVVEKESENNSEYNTPTPSIIEDFNGHSLKDELNEAMEKETGDRSSPV